LPSLSGQSQTGERAAEPWTPERQAKAQAKPAPDVDPAAVAAASEHVRSANQGGPEGATAAVVMAAAETPIGAQTAPEGERSGDYWTPERLRSAKPMPMPTIPEDSLIKPGPKNR
jgi:hypothetical protein